MHQWWKWLVDALGLYLTRFSVQSALKYSQHPFVQMFDAMLVCTFIVHVHRTSFSRISFVVHRDAVLNFYSNHEKHQNCVFSNLFAPWQETFADTRDGDGDGGGTIWYDVESLWDHFRIILRPFWIILGPPYANKLCFSTKNEKSLKWHILTSSPLFDRMHTSP